MMENLHPNTRAMFETLTREQCEEILNIKYTASDIQSQIERLEGIEKQLCKPNSVTIDGYVARDKVSNHHRGEGLHLFTTKPERASVFSEWQGLRGKSLLIDPTYFPEVTWESEPKRVKITITPMEE